MRFFQVLIILWMSCGEVYSVAKVIITRPESSSLTNVFLVKLDKVNLHYQKRLKSSVVKQLPRRAVKSIFFYEPQIFSDALALYKKGKFEKARQKFEKCKEEHAAYQEFTGNYSTLAGYYEIECMRRLGDLEGMDRLLNLFNPEALDNENYLTQIEIYSFWTALSRGSWKRVLRLADAWKRKLIPPSQRTQIRYCRALAIAELYPSQQALEALYIVIAGSVYTEPELIEKAFVMALEILLRNVRIPTSSQSQPYSEPLQEAIALAHVWNDSLGRSQDLPKRYQKLLKL